MSVAALGSTLCPLGLLLPVSLVLLVFECHLHIIDELGHTEKPKETKSARGPSTQSCRLALTTPWASLRAALARGWGQSRHAPRTQRVVPALCEAPWSPRQTQPEREENGDVRPDQEWPLDPLGQRDTASTLPGDPLTQEARPIQP